MQSQKNIMNYIMSWEQEYERNLQAGKNEGKVMTYVICIKSDNQKPLMQDNDIKESGENKKQAKIKKIKKMKVMSIATTTE